jgi:tocopherol cyclase
MNKKNRLSHPELFQGINKKRDYFEGWYFKHVSFDGKTTFSLIPGISYEGEKKHAFIQVIIGPEFRSYYISYDIEDFSYQDNPFRVKIDKNIFSLSGINLDIDSSDLKLKGHIKYNKITKIKRSFLEPNIMGFFAYFRFMQCYHGVISLNHELKGEIKYNKSNRNFNNGKGYIEKDWGTSFPKKYCWVQCNHFNKNSVSVIASVAHIPFLGSEFFGFIVVLKLEEKEYRFATYNKSKVVKAEYKDGNLTLSFKRKNIVLEIKTIVKEGLVLKAPKKGIMEDDIKETLEGILAVSLYDKEKLLFSGEGKHAGVEVVDWQN